MRKSAVLHIDDDPEFRRTTQFILERAGFEVFSARDGAEAASIVSHDRCAAVLTDSSGIAAAKGLVEIDPKMLLIVLSSSPRRDIGSVGMWVEKGNPAWHVEVVTALKAHLPSPGARHQPERLDVFAALAPPDWEQYRGKVLVVGDFPERIIACADTLREAELAATTAPAGRGSVRLIQGPPLVNMSLAELEGREDAAD